jgi:hypothetical protein
MGVGGDGDRRTDGARGAVWRAPVRTLKSLTIGGTPPKLPLIYGADTWDSSGQVVVTTLKTILLSIIILAGIAAWRAGMLT